MDVVTQDRTRLTQVVRVVRPAQLFETRYGHVRFRITDADGTDYSWFVDPRTESVALRPRYA